MRFLLFSVALAASFPLAAQAQPAQRLAAITSHSQNLALAERCKWSSDSGRAGLKALRDVLLAETRALDAGQTAAAEAAQVAGEKAAAAQSCDGADVNARRLAVVQAGDSAMAMMVLRAHALLDGETSQPFAYDLTGLRPYRSFIRQRAAIMQQNNAAAFQQMVTAFAPQIPAALAMVCAERKNVRWLKGDRPCPVLPAASQAQVPYARAIVQTAESFAAVYFPKPLSGNPGQLTGKFEPAPRGGQQCRIDKTIGTAKVTGTAAITGVYSFLVEAQIPVAQLRTTGKPPERPARFTMNFERFLAEMTEPRLQSVTVSAFLPGSSVTAVQKGSLTLAGKDVPVTARSLFETSVSTTNPPVDITLDGFDALSRNPDVSFAVDDLLSGKATLPDLARLLKALDHASLIAAYQQCWP